MQAIWHGQIAFGLVSIPIRVYAATESRTISFRQVHIPDYGRIRHDRRCEIDNQVVPWAEVGRGYETPDGRVVLITDADLDHLPLPTARTIEVHHFVPEDSLDPLLFHRSYYLDPSDRGVRPYVLLRNALEKSGRVAIAKTALRKRESLALIRVAGDVLVLTTLLWHDEVRRPDFAFLSQEEPQLRPEDEQMADMLLDALSISAVDLSEYRDTYREALEELIDAKLAHEPAPEVPQPRVVQDLSEALRESIAYVRRPG